MPEPGASLDLEASTVPAMIGIGALVAWGLSERLLHLWRLRQPASRQREWVSFFWCVGSWFFVVVYSLLDALVWHWTTLPANLAFVGYLGLPFVFAGLFIRVVSRLTLGRQFSGHVQTTEGHRLITHGIYGAVRHPLYLGFLCLLVGFPICFGSVGGFTISVTVAIPAVVYRLRIEESALLEWFGDDYRQYQARTSKLVPRVW
jgi:protein-S-isoprenylcysteine O-methyltransferase